MDITDICKRLQFLGLHNKAKDIQSIILANDEICNARKTLKTHLEKDSGFKQGYISNIAMTIYDNRQKDGRLNLETCNLVAELILKKLFFD